jgi:SHS2 domain-containing protein
MSKSFKFIDHTADIAAKITGSSLEELFSAGAEAWLSASVDDINIQPDDSIEIELFAVTKEELIVTFLNELNFLMISKRWLCISICSIKVFLSEEGCELSVELLGIKIPDGVRLKQEIKAVTYHQVEIVESNGEYSTLVVFDI